MYDSKPFYPDFPDFPECPGCRNQSDYPEYPGCQNRPGYQECPDCQNRPDYPEYPGCQNRPNCPNTPECPERPEPPCDCSKQKHVHEVTGSTDTVTQCRNCHNHRFSTVSGEAIPAGKSHVHEVSFRTDFADGHYHEFCGKSSPAIDVGGGKHVHFAKAVTTEQDGHTHKFQVASFIESPTDFEYK